MLVQQRQLETVCHYEVIVSAVSSRSSWSFSIHALQAYVHRSSDERLPIIIDRQHCDTHVFLLQTIFLAFATDSILK